MSFEFTIHYYYYYDDYGYDYSYRYNCVCYYHYFYYQVQGRGNKKSVSSNPCLSRMFAKSFPANHSLRKNNSVKYFGQAMKKAKSVFDQPQEQQKV